MDNFTLVLDINSFDIRIQKHLSIIEEEHKRVLFLEKQYVKKEEMRSSLSEQLSEQVKLTNDLENNLTLTDKEIARSNEALTNITSTLQEDAVNKELAKLIPQKDLLEEQIFELLENIDQIKLDLTETENFLSGLKQTIEEAKAEHLQVSTKESINIKQIEHNIEGVLEELESPLKEIFIKTRVRHRFNSPVTHLQGLACGKCRFQISRSDADQINTNDSYAICSSCGRILIAHKNF